MPCEFCGSTDPLTREHAWPDWALVYVRGRGDSKGEHVITSERYGMVHTRWKGPAPELTVRIVCDRCNHERLGSIEDEVAPILKPLIVGDRKLILRPKVALIALWAVKTAMVFEFTGDKRRVPFYTPSERMDLALERLIPDRTTVLVARYSVAQHWLFDHARDLVLAPADGSATYNALVSTTSIGQFVSQVVTHRAPSRDAVEIPKQDKHIVKQLWPSPPNLYWPPAFYLDDKGLKAFASGGAPPSPPGQGAPADPGIPPSRG